jgi:hypothetical protein
LIQHEALIRLCRTATASADHSCTSDEIAWPTETVM